MGQGFPVATNTKDKALVFNICIRGERHVGTVEAWRKLATSMVNDMKKLPAFTSVHIGPVELSRDGSQKLILLENAKIMMASETGGWPRSGLHRKHCRLTSYQR